MNPPPDEKRCVGTTKLGERCERWAIKGATVCRRHGGAAPQVKHAAEKRLQHAAAEKAVVTYGLPREIDPHTALLEELWRTAGHVAWLNLRIQELQDHEMHGPVGGGEMSIPREVPHVWVVMYQDERKHLAQVAATAIKAGIEERRVRLAEEQGQLLATVIRGILTDLGVADSPDASKVVRKHLQLVAGA